MNRSNYRVKVESKKQAKQFKQALLALGEVIAGDYYYNDVDHQYQNQLVLASCGWFCDFECHDLKEITFKELLTLLVTQVEVEQPKSGLLDGKCAIQVNNEREFKLLMEHYDSKGWGHITLQSPVSLTDFNHKNFIYSNRWISISEGNRNYTIIPFSAFAAEVGIKVPVLVMRSQDGVDLYEGDAYALARLRQCDWELESHCDGGDEYTFDMCINALNTDWINYKAFSTRKAAEKWIVEANKPKSVKIELATEQYIEVFEDRFEFTLGIGSFTLTDKHIREMNTAHKSLLTA